MKAVTITQPWATLLMSGHKQHETRSWHTRYRGPLVVHAGQGFPPHARALCATEPFRTVLRDLGVRRWEDLPRGAILGVVTLRDCQLMAAPEPAAAALFATPVAGVPVDELDEAFGDWTPGRFAWDCRGDRARLTEPIADVAGSLGLWVAEHASPLGDRKARIDPELLEPLERAWDQLAAVPA